MLTDARLLEIIQCMRRRTCSDEDSSRDPDFLEVFVAEAMQNEETGEPIGKGKSAVGSVKQYLQSVPMFQSFTWIERNQAHALQRRIPPDTPAEIHR
jgi:hypothetical protein